MRKVIIFLVCCMTLVAAQAQRVTRNYRDVSIADALRQLADESRDYTIYFLYNELEDFTITTHIKNKPVPEAIRQMIGFYPIRMTQGEKGEIYVECIHKTEHHLKGTIVDEQGQPLAYATIAILNPADSTLLTGGVSNESGRFVIPTEAKRVVVKCSFVGYRTYYRNCEAGDIGTIQMRPAEYIINGVTISQARNARDLLEHVEDLKIDLVSNKIQRMDGGSVKILINGIAASDIDLKGIPANKISRVEYYNIPPARYADAGTLINVITKRMETGINAGIEARTAFTTGFTDDEAYLNLTSGNHQFSLSYSFNMRDYSKRFGEQTYDYTLQRYLPDDAAPASPVHYNY